MRLNADPPPPTTAAVQEAAAAFYATARDYEQQFNQIELELRKLASVWMLVSFGALAYVIRGDLEPAKVLVEPEALIIIIALMAQVGLLLLWILDQVVYHGLLDAAFTASLHIERALPQLTPLRTIMLKLSSGTGMGRYMKYFYLVPITLYAGIAMTAWLWMAGAEDPELLWGGVAASSLIPIAWVLIKSSRIEAARKVLRDHVPGVSHPVGDAVIDRWMAALHETR